MARLSRTPLTPRQQACASLAADGLQSKEIARRLGLSQFTVAQYLSQAFVRLDVRNRTQLAMAMVRLGLLSDDASGDDDRQADAATPEAAGPPQAAQGPS